MAAVALAVKRTGMGHIIYGPERKMGKRLLKAYRELKHSFVKKQSATCID
jgi:hypothetical protein